MIHDASTVTITALLVAAGVLTGCSDSEPDRSEAHAPLVRRPLLGEQTFPEGIAAHAPSGSLFVGGLASGDIQRVDADGASYFWQGDGLNVIGMTTDVARNRLWVCLSSFADPTVPPQLLVFDIETAELLATFAPLDDGLPHFFNDVAVDAGGNAYVTDSFAPIVFAVDTALGGIEVLASDPAFIVDAAGFNLNGIAITPDDRFAIVSAPTLSGVGGKLFRIGLGDAGVHDIVVDPSFGSVDGLLMLEAGRLLGTGGRPSMHELAFDDDYESVTITPIGRFDDELDFVTTGALLADRVWLVNSQLDHFVGLSDGPPTLPFETVGVPLSEL